MGEVPPWAYAAVFLATLAMSMVLTPLALRLAVRKQVLDAPSELKAQTSPVPYLGGLAIVGAFGIAVMAAALVKRPTSGLDELALILGLGVGLAVMGLVDDLRGLGPWLRLGLEIAAGFAIWATSNGTQFFGVTALDLTLTVIWVVAVTNAFNLLDNMDGLSAGVATVAAGSFFIIAAVNGQFLVATLACALAGCSTGFLRSNFHPARIYMGDAGSLFLGFMLAVIGLKLRFEGPTQVTFTVPVLVLGVALFDTTLVTLNRLLHGRSPLSGGRDHTSHRMVMVGIPVPATVTLLYLGGVSLGWLAVIMSRVDRATAFVLMGWVISVGVVLGVLLSRVPVYETSRRRLLMIQEVRDREPNTEPGLPGEAAG